MASPWTKKASPGWSTAEMRNAVTAWGSAFVSSHSWATSWAAEEDYAGREIDYAVPFGPTGPSNEAFKARASAPVLRVRVKRHKGLAPVEVSRELSSPPTVPFIQDTLGLFTEALRALHKQDL